MSATTSFPKPGTVLWALDVDLEREVFRSGAASKPNVEYLRYIDIGIDDQDGRIPPDQSDKFMVSPGKGISLFLERMIPEGMVVVDPAAHPHVDKKRTKKIHWWGIDQKHPIPSGLQLIYDGQPPGHCTLTVTREIPIAAFLSLVSQIPFSQRGIDLVAPIY
ncbi:MAG: hypothetical protein KGZ69_18105 [Methylomonas sp.]|nr:hypothetical protein [Methylomonas sp.]